MGPSVLYLFLSPAEFSGLCFLVRSEKVSPKPNTITGACESRYFSPNKSLIDTLEFPIQLVGFNYTTPAAGDS